MPSLQFTLNEQFESWSFLMTSFFRMLPKLFFVYSLSLLIVTKLSCREDHFRVQKFFIMTKKPRRSRASFSHQQLIELERRFSIQRWIIFFFETWKMQQLTSCNKCYDAFFIPNPFNSLLSFIYLNKLIYSFYNLYQILYFFKNI